MPKNFTYMAGGPGEVLSRGALRVLVEKALRTNDTKKYKVCQREQGGERLKGPFHGMMTRHYESAIKL